MTCPWPGSRPAWAETQVAVDGGAAVEADAGFGITEFHHAKRGSAVALPDGRSVGYRFITGAEENAVLIAMRDVAVLYLPSGACERAQVDLNDESQVETLVNFMREVDDAHADGGASLLSLGVPVEVTSEASHVVGPYTFRFALRVEGRTYAAVESASHVGAPQSSMRPLFCDYGAFVSADELDLLFERTPSEQLAHFFARVDWNPLLVSLRTALTATLIAGVIGVLAGWWAMRLKPRFKSVVDIVFLMPMLLPPSVCGLLLLYVFGKNSATGRWLIGLGIDLPFTWPAAVLAAVVVSLPFMYQAARAAFEGVDRDMADAARTLGWSEWRVLLRLMMPLAAPSLVAGAVLSFARALGEFGATVFFAGNYAGVTQTMPLAIYYDWMAGDAATAWLWVVVTLVFSSAFLVIMRVLGNRSGLDGR